MLVLIMFAVTILEFLGGILIKEFFNKTLWDYSNFKFNIGKYIALEITLAWGVLSLMFIYIVKPVLERIIKKTPKWISILVFCLMIVDFIITCLQA